MVRLMLKSGILGIITLETLKRIFTRKSESDKDIDTDTAKHT